MDSCPDASGEPHPCQVNPTIAPWAEKKCNIINSDVFKDCHAKVAPGKFYENCLYDTCGCNAGGDCQCFCTSVAAYAQVYKSRFFLLLVLLILFATSNGIVRNVEKTVLSFCCEYVVIHKYLKGSTKYAYYYNINSGLSHVLIMRGQPYFAILRLLGHFKGTQISTLILSVLKC